MDIKSVLQNYQTPDVDYVPPVTSYVLGRKLYKAGKPYSACLTDDMRAGWLAAENAGAWAYFNAMQAEGLRVAI
jgi:hypothetical protein